MNLELFLFAFTMIFSFHIYGIDLKILIYAFWIIKISMKKINNRKISVNLYEYKLINLIMIIISYIMFITLINQHNEISMSLRYFRAIVSFVIIILFFQDKEYKPKVVINTIEIILLIHSISVIIGIIFPDFKNYIVFISNYEKKFLEARSTGLVSGYDFAGLLCNLGLILSFLIRVINKKKIVTIKTVIFILAAIFTSRYSIVITILILIIVFLYEIFKLNIREIIRIGKYVIPLCLLIFIFLVLTTELNLNLRETLFNQIPGLKTLYNEIIYSYADYSGRSTVSNHYYIDPNINFIFGEGYIPQNVDPGYIRNLYFMGIFGLALQSLFYLSIFLYVNKIRKINKNKDIKIIALFIMFMIIALFVMEFKLTFIFSSITFELMIILLVYLLRYKEFTSTIKGEILKYE